MKVTPPPKKITSGFLSKGQGKDGMTQLIMSPMTSVIGTQEDPLGEVAGDINTPCKRCSMTFKTVSGGHGPG